jgi:hypothetical protein
MSDNKFWVIMWSLFTAFLVVFTLSITSYNINKNKVRAALLKNGVAPLSINCALEDEYNREVKCIILALKEN